MQLQDALQIVLAHCPEPSGESAGPTPGEAGDRENRFRARDWASADADAHRWRDLSLYEICTARVRVADSSANGRHFAALDKAAARVHKSNSWTKPKNKEQRLYLALTGLLSLRARSLADVRVRALDGAREVDRLTIPPSSLVMLDADVAQPEVLLGLRQRGRDCHFMAPVADPRKWRVAQTLDGRTGDSLVEMRVPPALRRQFKLSSYVHWRMVPYHRHGYPRQTLVTSLLDPEQWPRHEISAIHSERWLWNAGSGRPSTGKQAKIAQAHPSAVLEHLWMALWAYNLLRTALLQCADALGEEPVRLDFAAALERVGTDGLRAGLRAALADDSADALMPLLGARDDWAELVRSEPPPAVQIAVDPL